LCIFLLISCTRSEEKKQSANTTTPPIAVLQPGMHPLWFQLTENGPQQLDTIYDAQLSAALVPWPLALHIRFFEVRENELYIVINRDGFMKIVPYNADGFSLYRFPDDDLWKNYSAGGFVFYENQPAALLYLDDRFIDTDLPPPNPRTWTFNMESNKPFPLAIPALEYYPPDWNIDTLRLADDGFWYYRTTGDGEIFMLRSGDLGQQGVFASLEDFQNSAPHETPNFDHLPLPPLPENFYYTFTAQLGDTIIAAWEEQEEYNTGAAGLMLIKFTPQAGL
jgi:hypothetical protein